MTLFPCPSPRGTNHAGLYLNEAGHLVDRHGALWGASRSMAMDEMPDLSDLKQHADEVEKAEERIRKFRDEIETYIQEADLHSRVRADIFEILERTVPRRDKYNYGPNATKEYKEADPGLGRMMDKRRRERAAGADQEVDTDKLSAFLSEHLSPDEVAEAIEIAGGGESYEADHEAVRRAVAEGLKGSGLSEDACKQITDHVLANVGRMGGDRLPANALANGSVSSGGFGGFGHGSKHEANEIASDSFYERFPGAERESTRDDFGYGTSNKRREIEQEQLRRRPRRRIALDEQRAQTSSDYYTRFPGARRLLG
jgi:hypothetical protein